MALSDLLIQFNASRPAVDPRGVFTREVAEALQRLIQTFNANVDAANNDLVGLTEAQYLVSTLSATLTNERVTTDTATVSWDHGTAAQAKANVVDGSITTAKLGGDITTAGKALLDDANAAAQRTTLGAVAAGAVTSGDLTMATARLLGRSTAGTGAIEQISIGSNLTLSGGTLSASGGGGGGTGNSYFPGGWG